MGPARSGLWTIDGENRSRQTSSRFDRLSKRRYKYQPMPVKGSQKAAISTATLSFVWRRKRRSVVSISQAQETVVGILRKPPHTQRALDSIRLYARRAIGKRRESARRRLRPDGAGSEGSDGSGV